MENWNVEKNKYKFSLFNWEENKNMENKFFMNKKKYLFHIRTNFLLKKKVYMNGLLCSYYIRTHFSNSLWEVVFFIVILKKIRIIYQSIYIFKKILNINICFILFSCIEDSQPFSA